MQAHDVSPAEPVLRPVLDAANESVRQVAIDEDWSALRFRRVEFIKSAGGSSAGTPVAVAIGRAGRK
jgi:hypothetical protein